MDTHFTLSHFKKDQRPSEKSELKDHFTKGKVQYEESCQSSRFFPKFCQDLDMKLGKNLQDLVKRSMPEKETIFWPVFFVVKFYIRLLNILAGIYILAKSCMFWED